MVEKTGDISFSYDEIISKHGERIGKSLLYKTILSLCYEKDFGTYFFCKFILGDLQEIGYPSPFRFNSLLRKWDKLVKSHKKLGVLCSRGHGKTVFFSQILPIYDMFMFRHRRQIIISASQEQANRILSDLKLIVENNEWLITKKNNSRWANETVGYNDGYILVKGIGSEILGEHVDRIILDDILRSDNKISDQQIEDYVDMTLDPMLLNRKGQMIIVGTPKSNQDIFSTIEGRAKEGGVWALKRFVAIIDYEKKILQCGDRFNWRDIMDKRLSMGPLKFAREYQLEFFSRDTSLFPEHLIKLAKDKGKDIRLIDVDDKRGNPWVFVVGVDVARSGSVSADYSVAVVLAYNTITQAKQIAHVWRSKGLKISEQAAQLANLSKRFGHPYFLVEKNNMGQDMIDDLVDEHNMFVDAFVTGGVGQKKEELIRFLINAFEHEQVVMPCGDAFSNERISIVEDELSRFCVTYTAAGNEKFEGVSSHDDIVMALALANRATQTVGIPFAVSNYRDGSGGADSRDPYETLYKNSSDESDIVMKIRMGLIQ